MTYTFSPTELKECALNPLHVGNYSSFTLGNYWGMPKNTLYGKLSGAKIPKITSSDNFCGAHEPNHALRA